MDNIIALNQFKSSLIDKEEYGNDGVQFVGFVKYTSPKAVSEILDVVLIIGGADPMVKLDIYDKGNIIKADKFHLDFNPRFTNTIFTFDKPASTLIIEGNSKKLGNYKVEISEP